jgi:hypothetical protein
MNQPDQHKNFFAMSHQIHGLIQTITDRKTEIKHSFTPTEIPSQTPTQK